VGADAFATLWGQASEQPLEQVIHSLPEAAFFAA